MPADASHSSDDHSIVKEKGDDGEVVLLGKTSPGVKRIEIISKHITLFDRIFLFIGVFLIAYAYGIDSTIRGVFQVGAPFHLACVF